MSNALFFKATNSKEACALLSKYGKKAKVLAGGTDLMAAINRRLLSPEVVISIGDVGLNYIKVDGKNLIIGATTSHTEIIRSAVVKEKAPLLAEAVRHIGSPAIRNMGTIGGNLVNASPAGDAATALLALGAKLKLISARGGRDVSIDEFFLGPGKTVLKPDELLQEVSIPIQGAGSKWAWYKLGKRKADICSVVSIAVALQMDKGICKKARITLGAVAPTPLLAKKAGALLEKKKSDEALIEQVAKVAAEETTPIDDVRGTAWYRRKVSEVLVKRLLNQILV